MKNKIKIFMSCFVLSVIAVFLCVNILSVNTSALTVQRDQYEFTDGVLHLKYGDFDAGFFRNFANKSSVTAITADDGVRFVGSFGGNSSNAVFRSYSSCTSMDFSNVDTSNVTDMFCMFYNCSSLTSLDVSGFDTSNVNYMSGMFRDCNSLTSLNVSCFDTSNVTSMDWMFSGCSKLTSLDVSGFDTSNVSNMSYMFYNCSSLTSLDVSGFDTSNVTYMDWMFYNCSSLTSLDVSGFDTSNVTSMNWMFNGCSSLTSLDLSGFDTSNVTSMGSMFSDCSSLTSLDLSGFDTSNVTSMGWMFSGCSSLTSLDISGFGTSSVTNMSSMFSGCSSLSHIHLPADFNVSSNIGLNNGKRISNIYSGWVKTGTFVKISGDGSVAEFVSDGGEYIWSGLKLYELVNNTLHLKHGEYDYDFFKNFAEKSSVKEITADTGVRFVGSFGGGQFRTAPFSDFTECYLMDFSNVDTSNVTSMDWMFSGCSKLTSLDVSGFDTSNVTNMSSMFSGCSSLASLALPVGFNVNANMYLSNGNLGWAKAGIYANVSGNGSYAVFVSDGGEYVKLGVISDDQYEYTDDHLHLKYGGFPANFFRNFTEKSSVTAITADVGVHFIGSFGGDWNNRVFSSYSSCTSMDFSNVDTSNVTDMSYMFYGCRSLTSLDLSGFDTSNVTSMDWMFYNCSSLTSLDLSGFDTSNVTNMADMFWGCSSLTSLDLSGFDTSNVTNMGDMFYDCSSITSLVLPAGFNVTSNMDLYNGLRWGRAGYNNIVSGLEYYAQFTSEGGEYVRKVVSDNQYEFIDSVLHLKYGDFDADFFRNFAERSSVTAITADAGVRFVGSFGGNSSNAVFFSYSSCASMDFSNVDTSNVSDMGYMFCSSSLTSLDLSGFDTSNVTRMSYMFYNCSSFTSLDVSGFDTSNVTYMGGMFSGCSSLTSLDLSGFDTSNVTYMHDMFRDCSKLTSLDLSGFDTSNVKNMGGMFEGCSSLTSLVLPDGFNVNSNMYLSNGNSGWAKAGTYTVISGRGSDAVFISEGGEYVKYVFSEDQYEYSDGVLHLKYGDFDADFFKNFAERSSVTAITTDAGVAFFGSFNSAFAKYSSCKTIDFSEVDTSNVTDMRYMFEQCSSLTNLDLSCFDTSNVTDMRYMFSYCSILKRLVLPSGFSVTSNMYLSNGSYGWVKSGTNEVISGSGSYAEFVSDGGEYVWLTYISEDNYEFVNGVLHLKYGNFTSDFFTSFQNKNDVKEITADDGVRFVGVFNNVFAAYGRYENCRHMDFSRVDTSRVTDMSYMFSGCSGLKDLNLSGFDTSNVTNMSCMFSGCSGLKELDLSGFNTSNVTSMSGMFSGCNGLTSIDISGFDTSSVTDMSYLFSNCGRLTSLNMVGIDTSNVNDMSGMFSGSSGLSNIDVSVLDTSNVTNMGNMFSGCSGLTSLDLSGFDTSNVVSMASMFSSCSSLTGLDVSGLETSNVTNMSGMFSGCSGLTSLDLSGFDTSNVTNMRSMLSGCRGLTSLDVSGFDTWKVTDMSSMFYGCRGLTSLDVSGFDTWKVTSMDNMFAYCSSLTNLDLSNFETFNTTNMMWMFYGCSSLKDLDISGFDISGVSNVSNMLSCSSLSHIVLPEGFNITSNMSLNNGKYKDGAYSGWKKVGTNENVSGTGYYAEFTSEGGEYVWLTDEIVVVPGDVNGDGVVTSDDAIHLLYYTFLPDQFPVNQNCDFDGNGTIDSDDAIYLLYYTFLPDMFPLN